MVKELEPLRKRDWLSKWNGTHLIQGSRPTHIIFLGIILTPFSRTLCGMTGPVQAVLTGNGFNHDVRAIVPTLDIIDVFIDARKLPSPIFT